MIRPSGQLGAAELATACPFCEQPAGRVCVTRIGYSSPAPVHSARLKAYRRLPRPATFADGPVPDLGLVVRAQSPARLGIQLDAVALADRARHFAPPDDTPTPTTTSLEALRSGMYAATMLDALADLGVLERLPDGSVARAPCTCEPAQPASPTHD